MSIDPVTAAFQAALNSADPVFLLTTAEAAAYGVDQSGAAQVAATAVSAAIGYPLPSDTSTRVFFISSILGRLRHLSALGYTKLPTLITDNPRGNSYTWRF